MDRSREATIKASPDLLKALFAEYLNGRHGGRSYLGLFKGGGRVVEYQGGPLNVMLHLEDGVSETDAREALTATLGRLSPGTPYTITIGDPASPSVT